MDWCRRAMLRMWFPPFTFHDPIHTLSFSGTVKSRHRSTTPFLKGTGAIGGGVVIVNPSQLQLWDWICITSSLHRSPTQCIFGTQECPRPLTQLSAVGIAHQEQVYGLLLRTIHEITDKGPLHRPCTISELPRAEEKNDENEAEEEGKEEEE